MSRCLVTGHKGYIGSKLYKELQKQGHEVLGIDFKEGHPTDHPTDRPINILEYNGLKERTDGAFHPTYWNFKPEYIFHLACIPRVAYSVEEPIKTMENNVLATSYVLNFARKVGAKRVIYSGSSSVIGNGNGPTNPYGLQKLISEMECKLYSDLYGLDTVSLRYFNVYSPCQTVNSPYATAIANWMHSIKSGKNPYITGDGEQRRDMAYLDDIVSANIFAMHQKIPFGGKHYDVGTGNNISLNEIKDIVLRYHSHVKFDYVEPRKGDVLYTKANINALNLLGWKPTVSILEGVNKCFGELK